MKGRILISALVAILVASAVAWAANNVAITPGSGKTMACIDISGTCYPESILVDPTTGAGIYGTAGTASTDVVTIQGIASMTPVAISAASLPLPTSASTSALQTTGNTALSTINTTLGSPFQAGGALGAGSAIIGNVRIDQTTPGATNGVQITAPVPGLAIGSTTAGQTGSLIFCAAATAAPTTTTADSWPCSMNVTGGIRGGGGVAGTADGNVVTVQGIASMTKLLVTPDSVALPANQSVNTAQVNGITTLTGAGVTGTGSQRETVAQDTTTIAGSAPGTAGSASANVVTVQGVASMTKLLVTPDSVALPANQSVNVAQINAVTPLMGNGVTGTGSPRVTIASDNSAIAGVGAAATGSAPGANAVYIGASGSGNLTGMVACDGHTFKHITTATDTLVVQGVTAKTVKVCGALATFAGTATVFLENTASTNANCSSSNTQITGLWSGVAQSVMGFYSPFWGGLANTSANGLCINSTGTGGVDVDIWWTQGS